MNLPNNNHIATVKVVLLGDSGVGKTSLAIRFAKNEFNSHTNSTIGASFLTKTIQIANTSMNNESANNISNKNGRDTQESQRKKQQKQPELPTIQFHIWDTAGQEKYDSITSLYYRGAEAAILVFDLCNELSFQSIQKWVDQVKHKGPDNDILLIICGNKYDLTEERCVSRERGEDYATSVNATMYVETSARDDWNVLFLFQHIGQSLMNKNGGQRGMMVNGDEIENLVAIGYDDIGIQGKKAMAIDLDFVEKERWWSCC